MDQYDQWRISLTMIQNEMRQIDTITQNLLTRQANGENVDDEFRLALERFAKLNNLVHQIGDEIDAASFDGD